MSNQQNDIIEETKQEAIAERTYTAEELKEIVNKELIKMIETVSDWEEIAQSIEDYSTGLIPLETHNNNMAFYMGLIKARTKDSKKVEKELGIK